MNELLMIPEARALWEACVKSGIYLRLSGYLIQEGDEWLLKERPTPDFWCRNQFDVLVEEIEALHRALWERGDRMKLEVRGYDQTFRALSSTGFEFNMMS